MANVKVMAGSHPADESYRIKVTASGPYLVYGRPLLKQQFIMNNAEGESWYYQAGAEFSTDNEPTSLCRCGASKNTPYCDGSHTKAEWDPTLTAPHDSLLKEAEIIDGDDLTLVDNERYCCYARFCHPKGGVWALAEKSADKESRDLAVRESMLCPGSRLTAWAVDEDTPYEYEFRPDLGLLEDPSIGASAGLWVRGGIAVEDATGEQYEVRNRVVLCRCGASHNKPYCDGSHASTKWRDNLPTEPSSNERTPVEEKDRIY